MRSRVVSCLVLVFGLAASAGAQTRGTLMIVGGGPRADDVARRYVELAGGAKGKILIFPMASGEPAASGESSAKSWAEFGMQSANTVLTHEQALTADTAAMFKGVTAVWFPGGDQARLTAALNGTPVLTAIRSHYRAGAVVGGTSAGAAVMSQIMLTGDEKHIGGKRPPADSSAQAFITIARENIVTIEGFGLVTNAIVDQHFLRRKRHNRLISLVLENPSLVGAGIDESTAIEVRPDGKWRVWGESVVVIYDARSSAVTKAGQTLGGRDLRMHILPAGSTYDLAAAKATLPE